MYRCPACGELVDKESISQVLEHHQHVLHAPGSSTWFDRRPDTSGTQVNADTPAGVTERRAETSAVSPELLLRRYGH